MRPILFRILLEHPWTPWVGDVGGVPGVGAGILWIVLGLLGLAHVLWHRRTTWTAEDRTNAVGWVVVFAAIAFAAPALAIDSLPIFGYGAMVLLGFLAAIWVGQRRARQQGVDSAIVFDAAFWTLIGGVVGGRLFYLIQHGDRVFQGAEGFAEILFAAVNLSNGGLVLIGAMVGGAAGFFPVCYRRGVAPLSLLDILTPSIFVGIGFGRIGCLLYGCCFGDPSSLPWAVVFPKGSPAFETLSARGFLSPEAQECIPLHPTQVYSSINAFLLALVTWTYTPFRRHIGSVFALGLILYPMTRFFIEFLRSDELPQLGTSLTISQLLSIALFAGGIALATWLHYKGHPVVSNRKRRADSPAENGRLPVAS